ncbi:MAG TPA: serine O-acetyltransferase [Vicinamibacterales bacterium]
MLDDIRAKAEWNYQRVDRKALLSAAATDGTGAMVIYRLMQWAGRRRLSVLALLFNKLNAVFNNCIIGRGADFGPRFVLIHATGVVINGDVTGGADVRVEHQVTIGAEGRRAPVLGDRIFIGAGAKIIGGVTVGSDARIGANAVVVHDVPPHCTVVGIPARVVRRRQPAPAGDAPHSSAVALT